MLYVYPSITIQRIKDDIQQKEGVPCNQKRLIHAGKQLPNHKTLLNYHIDAHSLVHLFVMAPGPQAKVGKPVIYLRSPVEMDADIRVGLVRGWSFSAIYPVVPVVRKDANVHEWVDWSVRTGANGCLVDKKSGSQVSYLFWEALTNDSELSPPPSPVLGAIEPFRPEQARYSFTHVTSVALSIEATPLYVDLALLELGLDTEARTSFITYWLPSFLEHKHILLSFIPQVAYEKAAPMTVIPLPDVITRVFMIFRELSKDQLGVWAGLSNRPAGTWRDIVGVPEKKLQQNTSLFTVMEVKS
ncbi:ubiquitin-domain-containing protein [Mycena amicta]|nr:ubiquitin-domain-containing protein [Mycena amicta]